MPGFLFSKRFYLRARSILRPEDWFSANGINAKRGVRDRSAAGRNRAFVVLPCGRRASQRSSSAVFRSGPHFRGRRLLPCRAALASRDAEGILLGRGLKLLRGRNLSARPSPRPAKNGSGSVTCPRTVPSSVPV